MGYFHHSITMNGNCVILGLFSCHRFMPAGSSKVCILEESIVDVESQTLTTYTRNVGLTKFMVSMAYYLSKAWYVV